MMHGQKNIKFESYFSQAYKFSLSRHIKPKLTRHHFLNFQSSEGHCKPVIDPRWISMWEMKDVHHWLT